MPVLVYELVTTSKAAWPKACPLFTGSFKLQNGIFSWTPLKTEVGLPTASSLGPIQGLLWGLYSQRAVNTMHHGRTFYPPIQSRKTLADFILKRSNFSGHQKGGHKSGNIQNQVTLSFAVTVQKRVRRKIPVLLIVQLCPVSRAYF